ncbi:glycosyltransferase family 2 protein [Tabrizicola sp.]|uniref:glycosyltransferase family 2 protein n=1 Tax=Tabrizicola sp. TaxID=2005166 RepID=UPI003F3A174B
MAKPKKVIVACMRNEALFLVEWLAHHLAMGFDRIVVYTNDCEDGTDVLLDLLSQTPWIEHFDNPGPYDMGGTIQRHALHLAFQLPHVRGADWAMHIDADEYLNVTIGKRSVDDLAALYPDADAIAIMWRHFGSSGKKTWEGGSIIESFTRCEDKLPDVAAGQLANFKTLFRPRRFRAMSIHSPKYPRRGVVPVVVNTAGVEMPVEKIKMRRGSGYAVGPHQVTWANACLHHHHVKSDDLHRMKHARGDANGRNNAKRRIGSEFHAYADRNEAVSTSMLGLRRRVRRWEARLRAIPGVIEAEAAAWSWFRARFPVEAGEEHEPGLQPQSLDRSSLPRPA